MALALQVGTNYANDYSDGVRGTDSTDRVGPTRLVASGLASPSAVKRAAVAAFGVAALAGLALTAAVSWWLLLVGAVSFAAGWLYTGGPRPSGTPATARSSSSCSSGSSPPWARPSCRRSEIPLLAVGAAVPVGFLATALLVVNNLRDIPSDAASGKRTLAVRTGDRATRVLYVALLVATFVAVPFVAGLGERPLGAAALGALLLARRPVLIVLEGAEGAALVPVLEATGRTQLVFGVLLAAGLYLSA
ncbi:MAG: 1,4-dihydroxy-2-naphthoate octaprenyltransferase [Acidimicrobiia bacterium]|nr:1,4-dihydroxy-2-naphthoate octaprenyltransferase [Acidimicrobiia bacterium]